MYFNVEDLLKITLCKR